MSQYHFGVSSHRVSREDADKIERAAKKHGVTFVEATLPGQGYQRWFVARSRGECHDRVLEGVVYDEIDRAGVELPYSLCIPGHGAGGVLCEAKGRTVTVRVGAWFGAELRARLEIVVRVETNSTHLCANLCGRLGEQLRVKLLRNEPVTRESVTAAAERICRDHLERRVGIASVTVREVAAS